MIVAPDRPHLIENLRRMMDELRASDLTPARADVLRPRVARLLESLGGEADPVRGPAAGPRDARGGRPRA